ncbi:probable methyltransferase PMT5 [Primulina eburnea]|uniref:probable methyltransferase PMT5 n=1 Tax=Primulina eburnea TaxID=1245227 RepID=UPI003C6CBA9C
MRSFWCNKLHLIFGSRLPVNWLLLCLVSVFVLIALFGSSSTTFDSVTASARPENYLNYIDYRRLKEGELSDYFYLKNLGSDTVKDFSLCGKERENYVPYYNVSASLLAGFKDGEEFDRHSEVQHDQHHCLVRPPRDYKIPLNWPSGRDIVWTGNVKLSKDQFLSSGSMTKRLMLLEENQISFHSDDDMLVDGVKDYSHQIAEMIGLESDAEFCEAGENPEKFKILFFPCENVLHFIVNRKNINCHIPNFVFDEFASAKLQLKLMAVCIAAYESTGSQVQLALERGLPAIIGSFV